MRRLLSLLLIVSVGAATTGARAAPASSCDPKLLDSVREAEHIVLSLHPDKPGQARVVASDLSEYTGGQTLWLRGELRAVDRACKRNDSGDAIEHLRAVQEVLRSHGSVNSAANRV
jgi:hypothetical protein